MGKSLEIPHCETCLARIESVFDRLKPDELEKLSLHKGCNFYRAGQVLFQEGGFPAGLYCINRGKIKLYKTDAAGKEQIVRLAKEGDVVGYRALISGEPYSASAAVLEDATICFIPKAAFLSLLAESASLNLQVMQLLCHDLSSAEEREFSLARKPVRARLAESLMMLRRFYGLEDDGMTIKGSLTREDLANIVGTATETIIRLLYELRARKIIELDKKRIKILNEQALLKIIGVYD